MKFIWKKMLVMCVCAMFVGSMVGCSASKEVSSNVETQSSDEITTSDETKTSDDTKTSDTQDKSSLSTDSSDATFAKVTAVTDQEITLALVSVSENESGKGSVSGNGLEAVAKGGESLKGEAPDGEMPNGEMPDGEMPDGEAPGGESPDKKDANGEASGGERPGMRMSSYEETGEILSVAISDSLTIQARNRGELADANLEDVTVDSIVTVVYSGSEITGLVIEETR